MCGIVGFTGYQRAAPILLEGLSKLECRGYDSAGMIADCENTEYIVSSYNRAVRKIEKNRRGKSHGIRSKDKIKVSTPDVFCSIFHKIVARRK